MTGPEPLAGQHHPHFARRWHDPAVHRVVLGDGVDLEPIHIRQGHRVGRLRRRHSRQKPAKGLSNEDLFFELAIEDLRRAADLFLPIHQRTDGVDGWVSLEVSPKLAYDTAKTVEAAKSLHERAGRRNLFIKIPGTPEGLPAITEAIAPASLST